MYNNKNIKAMSALFALGMLATSVSSNQGRFYEPEYDRRIKGKVIPAGCKEYSFYGFTVIASSEKAARKKCKKKLDLAQIA